MILDACRNNPFGGRGLRAATGGLAQMKAPEGTLISYATQPGNVAIDGADGNSPFTKALARTIKRPGLDVFRLFNEVGLQVKQATSGAQQPWVSNSPIDGDFYFMQVPAGSTVTIQPPGAPPPAAAVDREVVLWNSVKDSRNPALLQTYLDQFPQGTFAGAARVLIADLSKPPVAKTQVAAAPARTDLASLLASPPPINPKVDQLYATGLAELPNYRFGRSLAAVSNASWLQLPVAGEFRRNEVRYFFQSTRQLMPNWSALGCVSAKSYILFMFESQELVGLSIRFLGDNECPNHRAWLEHFAGLVGAPVVELDRSVGLFRAAGSSVEVRGLSIPHKGATAIDIMPQRASGLMTDLEWVEFHRN
jgi:hypothetical protein